MNLKEVQKDAPAAAALLNYCAFLHPDGVPFNLFTQGAAELGEPRATALADAADDPLELYDLLNPLGSYSLIRVEPESQSLSLHRLVQEVIRAELGDAGCQNWVEPLFRAIGQLTPEKGKDIDYRDWPPLAPLVNHVQELASHCQQHAIASTEAADVFHVMGAYLLERGQYALAEPLLQKALDLRRNLLGDEHEDIAASLDQAASLYYYQGRYGEAEPLYQDALAMRKRLLGDEHPDVAQSLNNLATLYQRQDRYGDAQPLLIETVNLVRQLLGHEHPNLAISLNNLARCYRETAGYDRAEDLCQEALAIAQAALPTDHQLNGRFLDDFATLRAAQGRIEEARSLYQQALAILEPKLGAEHPWTVRCRENLAKLDDGEG